VGQLLTIEKWAENLEEVTLNKWLAEEGDALAAGDSLCEMITDKMTFEYEVEQAGILRKKYCPEKSVLPIGYAFAFVGEPSEPLPEGVEEENARLMAQHAQKAALELTLDLPAAASRRQQAAPERRVRATPAARRVARERNVSIEEVAAWRGTGEPVTEADVEAFCARNAPGNTRS
jgi:pyruvate dehydrogenase E2 component (dihydrolipoamide acetyltransferase)